MSWHEHGKNTSLDVTMRRRKRVIATIASGGVVVLLLAWFFSEISIHADNQKKQEAATSARYGVELHSLEHVRCVGKWATLTTNSASGYIMYLRGDDDELVECEQ